MSHRHVMLVYYVFKLHFRKCLGYSDQCFQLSYGDGNVLLFAKRNCLVLVSVIYVEIWEDFARSFWKSGSTFSPGCWDVFFKQFCWDVVIMKTLGFRCFEVTSLMLLDHMLSHQSIPLFISLILYNENAVKSRQNCALELDLLSCCFKALVESGHWISCSKHRTSWIKHSRDACFCDRNSLLLHGFMNSYSVFWSHFIELVDTDHTSISQNHSTSFKLELSRGWVSQNRSCQTSSARSLATRVYTNRRHSFYKLQKLTLCGWWISEKQHINITSETHAIWEIFSRPTEEETSNSTLNVLRAVDGRSDALGDHLNCTPLIGYFFNLIFFFLRCFWHESAQWCRFRWKANDAEIGRLSVWENASSDGSVIPSWNCLQDT